MKKPLELSDNDFSGEISSLDVPVLVDFWASWCPPCKMAEPILRELSEELDGTVKVAKINVDRNPATAGRYGIKGVPTFILFEGGREMCRRVGAQSRQQLLDMLKEINMPIIDHER